MIANKYKLSVLIALIVALTVFWLVKPTKATQQSVAEAYINDHESSSPTIKALEPEAAEAVATLNINGNDIANQLAQLQHLEAEWNREHGYFTEEEFASYAGYNINTLLELAKADDLLAIEVLIQKSFKLGKRDRAALLSRRAAVLGSTNAIRHLSSISEAAITGQATHAEELEYYKQMLMHSEVAAMRGDRKGIWMDLQTLDYKEISLTPADLSEISVAAAKEYDSLLDARATSGLGEFDNSENFYTAIRMDIALPKIPNSNGWALQYMAAKNVDTTALE